MQDDEPVFAHDSAIYTSLRKGPATAAELRKATKLSEEDLDEVLTEWKGRLWISEDDSGRKPEYTLTEHGQRDMASRYPD